MPKLSVATGAPPDVVTTFAAAADTLPSSSASALPVELRPETHKPAKRRPNVIFPKPRTIPDPPADVLERVRLFQSSALCVTLTPATSSSATWVRLSFTHLLTCSSALRFYAGRVLAPAARVQPREVHQHVLYSTTGERARPNCPLSGLSAPPSTQPFTTVLLLKTERSSSSTAVERGENTLTRGQAMPRAMWTDTDRQAALQAPRWHPARDQATTQPIHSGCSPSLE